MFAHQPEIFARPGGQYILINIVSAQPVGTVEMQKDAAADNTVDISYSNLYNIFVSINTYKDTALNLATKLRDSLNKITVHEELYSNGIGYLRSTAVQDIPENIDSSWEQRGQFDCFFAFRSLETENIETIASVELTSGLDDETIIITKP